MWNRSSNRRRSRRRHDRARHTARLGQATSISSICGTSVHSIPIVWDQLPRKTTVYRPCVELPEGSCFGKTLMQTFLDAKHLAKEKELDHFFRSQLFFSARGARGCGRLRICQIKSELIQLILAFTYPGGSGIDSLRQILFARRFAISEWRGIASA